MKKVLNLISLIVLIVGVALAGASLVLADVSGASFLVMGTGVATVLIAVLAFLGAVLSRVKGTAGKVGRGLLLAGAALLVGYGIYPMLAGDARFDGAYLYEIIALIAGALILVHFIFVLLADKAATADDDVVVDEKIALIYKYKDLMDDGIITKEEFNAKKAELMAPQAKAKR